MLAKGEEELQGEESKSKSDEESHCHNRRLVAEANPAEVEGQPVHGNTVIGVDADCIEEPEDVLEVAEGAFENLEVFPDRELSILRVISILDKEFDPQGG